MPPLRQIARLRQKVVMFGYLFPEIVQSRPRPRATGHDRRHPCRVRRRDEMHRIGVVARRARRPIDIVAIGLVDGDHVRNLQDAALDALQLVTSPGDRQHEKEVDHLRYGDLGLSDANGFHQDHIETGGLANIHRLAGAPGDAT